MANILKEDIFRHFVKTSKIISFQALKFQDSEMLMGFSVAINCLASLTHASGGCVGRRTRKITIGIWATGRITLKDIQLQFRQESESDAVTKWYSEKVAKFLHFKDDSTTTLLLDIFN
uniref:Uncharacterized protein n=1 Tax=Glossina pallidipes TaxID=7398 RepID=A0A1A9ZH29_GLOPL